MAAMARYCFVFDEQSLASLRFHELISCSQDETVTAISTDRYLDGEPSRQLDYPFYLLTFRKLNARLFVDFESTGAPNMRASVVK